eukprot:scaffold1558_cov403-Prasinococcus_capsulatus_cf.AAC.32
MQESASRTASMCAGVVGQEGENGTYSSCSFAYSVVPLLHPLVHTELTRGSACSQIVNNESSEIVCMFNSAFNAFAKNPDLNLDPIGTQEAQEEVNSWIYPTINNGVYRCGFAKSQEAYDEAVSELDASLDKLEELLSKQRYVTGDKLTISDIRLFVTLVRFDEVYVVYFKTNTKALREYPNILNYMRELYQIPEIQKTVSMYHIKTHYFTSHPTLNHYAIVPKVSFPSADICVSSIYFIQPLSPLACLFSCRGLTPWRYSACPTIGPQCRAATRHSSPRFWPRLCAVIAVCLLTPAWLGLCTWGPGDVQNTSPEPGETLCRV